MTEFNADVRITRIDLTVRSADPLMVSIPTVDAQEAIVKRATQDKKS